MKTNTYLKAFGWGVLATVAMSIIMIIGKVTGMSPMPKPVPLAIVAKIFGKGSPMPLLMAIAIIFHLAYGGFFGAVFMAVTQKATIGKGLLWGLLLWFIMQIVVFPFLGWGFFGTAITPKIAVATLVLHLVYGGTLGWLLARKQHEKIKR